MAAEIVTYGRRIGRRVMAAIAAAAAAIALGYVLTGAVAAKDAALAFLPAFAAISAALLSPWLWRASSGTRFAAILYLGLPASLAIFGPVQKIVPTSLVPYVSVVLVLALASVIFVVEARRVFAVAPADGWCAIGGKRLRFDEVSIVLWDGLDITSKTAFTSSREGVERLVLVDGTGTKIDLNTVAWKPLAAAALSKVREWSCAALCERIAAAVAEGEIVRAGAVTIAPDGVTIYNQHFPIGARASIVNGALRVEDPSKPEQRPRFFPTRTTPNALIVPAMLQFIDERRARGGSAG